MTEEAERLRSSLLRKCHFGLPGGAYNVAVSGGPDSFALLILAVAVFTEVSVWHVDHGLRAEASEEGLVVGEVARSLGASFQCVRANLTPGANLEERARIERRRLLPVDAATGHTADDQAETVLLNMMRGAGTDGLRGIKAGPKHPLLGIRRHQTLELCAAWDIEPIWDRSNNDLAFRRNSVRHVVLPMLAQVWDRDPVPILCRQASLVAQDGDLLDELSASIDPVEVKSLKQAPPPLAKRALRRWLADELGHVPPRADIERVLDVARGRFVGTQIVGGRMVRRTKGRLFVTNPSEHGSCG